MTQYGVRWRYQASPRVAPSRHEMGCGPSLSHALKAGADLMESDAVSDVEVVRQMRDGSWVAIYWGDPLRTVSEKTDSANKEG